MLPLDQQVIVITGTSSGIGRCTAVEAAKRGAKVVLAARSVEGLEETRREAEAAGGEAITVPTDVADYAQMEALGQRALERFGRIDTWVNNAAVAIYAEFGQTTPEEFKRVVEVNLMGQVYGTMVALSHLRERGGAIVNVGSVESYRALPLHSAYAASKHGVKGFTEALRTELDHNRTPVHLTLIKPASIDTPLFQHARSKIDAAPRPFPPVYDPILVAEAILHAAVHPTRELTVGGAGAALIAGETLSPRLVDAQLAVAGYPLQQTDSPPSESPTDNLFTPSAPPWSIRGGWDGRRTSLYTTLQLNDDLRRAVLGVAALAGFAFGRSRLRSAHR
ncbi:MAG: hypothetical protein QOJ59_752 [Thermomicrobiales bacterium]|jgi:NAD(P)-dependent dehydrogenase (short-subunit alcohol dehydrogenase family)|nr:hypothetical protein [Thermomicrobiales bacterium]